MRKTKIYLKVEWDYITAAHLLIRLATHAHTARVRRSSGLASAANFRTSHLSVDARIVDKQHNLKGEHTVVFCKFFKTEKGEDVDILVKKKYDRTARGIISRARGGGGASHEGGGGRRCVE